MRALRAIVRLPLRLPVLLVLLVLHLRWRLRIARGRGWRHTAPDLPRR